MRKMLLILTQIPLLQMACFFVGFGASNPIFSQYNSEISPYESINLARKKQQETRKAIEEFNELAELIRMPKLKIVKCEGQKVFFFQLNFQTEQSDLTPIHTGFLEQKFSEHLSLENRIPKEIAQIQIFGHSDLQGFSSSSIQRNKDLGKKRAKGVRNFLLKTILSHPDIYSLKLSHLVSQSKAISHLHPFLGECEEVTSCNLIKTLGHNELLSNLEKELNINTRNLSDNNVYELRINEELQNVFRGESHHYWRSKFEAFRSVVVIITYE